MEKTSFFKSIFDYSASGNYRDGLLHEFLLAFYVFFPLALLGLIIGWLMWRNCKKRCAEIEAENARIRAKQSTI